MIRCLPSEVDDFCDVDYAQVARASSMPRQGPGWMFLRVAEPGDLPTAGTVSLLLVDWG
jgi:hypothetical protein